MVFDNLKNRGVLYGDGIFETMRVGPDGVWEMNAHIERLKKSSEFFGFSTLANKAISEVRSLKTEDVCLVRLTILRDGIEEGLLPGGEGGIFWNQRSMPNIGAPQLIGLNGLYVPGHKLHEFKTTSYMRSIHCKRTALGLGFSDGVMLSAEGLVGEASTSNVWAVFDDYVVTPNISGILPGIVRAAIISRNLGGLRIEERALLIEELLDAREIGLSSVGIGVVAADSFHYQGRTITLDSRWSNNVARELFCDG